MTFSSIDTVLWDWNGTLLDDLHLTVHITNDVLAAQGARSIDVKHHRENFVFPIADYYTHLGLPPDKVNHDAIHAVWGEKYETRKHECGLHEAADEVLGALSARGYSQAVLSAYPHDLLHRTIAHYGIDHHFRGMFGNPANDGRSKLATARRLVETLGIDAARTVIVGDTHHDAEVAAELGCTVILVSHGHQSHSRLSDRHNHVCRSLRAVHDLITGGKAPPPADARG